MTHNQVYAVVAFLLQLNGMIAENSVMDAKTLPQVKMPNRGGFTSNPRPDTGSRPAKK
jgi:hypothetical protein